MQKKILVDHSVASNALSEQLRREGYVIEETEDEQKALCIIRPEKYVAIISDVFSDGLRVLEKAKVIPFPVPVILMANEHVLTRNEAIQLGADELRLAEQALIEHPAIEDQIGQIDLIEFAANERNGFALIGQ